MLSSGGSDTAPLVVVDLEPVLLAALLREALSERGVAVAGPADRSQPAAVALVSESTPAAPEAEVVVRLPDSGQTMPTVVEVASPGADMPRPVVVDDVDELIDLLVGLAGR